MGEERGRAPGRVRWGDRTAERLKGVCLCVFVRSHVCVCTCVCARARARARVLLEEEWEGGGGRGGGGNHIVEEGAQHVGVAQRRRAALTRKVALEVELLLQKLGARACR